MQLGATGTRNALSTMGGGIHHRWYKGIEHCSAFSSSGPSPFVVNGHTLTAAFPTPVPMTHTSLGFKIFVKNEDFKFNVKYNVKIT